MTIQKALCILFGGLVTMFMYNDAVSQGVVTRWNEGELFPIEFEYPSYFDRGFDSTPVEIQDEASSCSGSISLNYRYPSSTGEEAIDLSVDYTIFLSDGEIPQELKNNGIERRSGVWYAEGFTFGGQDEYEMEEELIGKWKSQYAIVPARYYYTRGGVATAAGEAERYLIQKKLKRDCTLFVLIDTWGGIDEWLTERILDSIQLLPTKSELARNKLNDLGVHYTKGQFFARSKLGDTTVVSLFVQSGMPVDARDRSGQNALIFARDTTMIGVLLSHKADLEARTSKGMTPLMVAAGRNDAERLAYLLKAGAKVNPIDPNGRNAVFLVTRLQKPDREVFVLLAEAGADLDARRDNDWTPVIHAASKNRAEQVQWLIELGADYNLLTLSGEHAVHIAASQDAAEAMDVLFQAGVDPNIRNQKGNTPLITASKTKQCSALQKAIDWGADLDARDAEGRTALHVAVKSANECLTRYLLIAGADPNIAYPDGAYPLAVSGSRIIRDLLRAAGGTKP